MVVFLPALTLSWCNYIWFGMCLNFLTIVCYLGLHEVARELENPFLNAPNDLPLTTYQAQYNESLISMFAGYHPDAFWDAPTPKIPTSDGKHFVETEKLC
mmetsp:Transcript_30556/g.45208  ORF Transcript_30556/g.45208 Transcript_30556/m.45208 type:complete len:100 (+) Transcript_30556:208-507(+)